MNSIGPLKPPAARIYRLERMWENRLAVSLILLLAVATISVIATTQAMANRAPLPAPELAIPASIARSLASAG